MLRGLRLLVPALFLSTSACAHSGGGDTSPEIRETGFPAYVEVQNQHALPMEVYAFASGITQRLGTVHPGMSGRFTLPQNLIGNGSVQFEARPSGGGKPFRSGEILLSRVPSWTWGSQPSCSTAPSRVGLRVRLRLESP